MGFQGIFAAVVTPFKADGEIDFEGLNRVLDTLKGEGCEGVLLSGTTGEGPSLSVPERLALFREARTNHPDLTLLAGTGAASPQDAADLTADAIRMGCDAALILPPFFFMRVPDDGLFRFYQGILGRVDPTGPGVFLYQNPTMAPALSVELVSRLLDAYPEVIVGIKDSSGDMAYTRQIIPLMSGKSVLIGKDNLLSEALEAGVSGAITACSNVHAPLMVRVLEGYQQGDVNLKSYQDIVTQSFSHLTTFPVAPAMKAILHKRGILPSDAVRAPLMSLSADDTARLLNRLIQKG